MGLGGKHCPSHCPGPVCAGRRRNVNCLKNVVIWYEDHKHRCPYEPHLAELDPTFGLYTTAVWQCEAGHRYFQDLHSPLKPLSDSDPESDKGGSAGGAGRAHHGLRGLGPCQHQASITDLTASNTALTLRDLAVLESLQSRRAGPHSAKGPPGRDAVCPRSGAGRAGIQEPSSVAGEPGRCWASPGLFVLLYFLRLFLRNLILLPSLQPVLLLPVPHSLLLTFLWSRRPETHFPLLSFCISSLLFLPPTSSHAFFLYPPLSLLHLTPLFIPLSLPNHWPRMLISHCPSPSPAIPHRMHAHTHTHT